MTEIQKTLFRMQDKEYKLFSQKLMPTVPKEKVIGIRVPKLRKFANSFYREPEAKRFMKNLPHKYFEEDNLHALLLEKIKDYNIAIAETERFLPHIDNWATCDMFVPTAFKNNTKMLIDKINIWIKSSHSYTVRYAIELLMKLYLDENFSDAYPKLVASVKSDEYYVKMMIAWYFATALSKQYDFAIAYLENNNLDEWTHNKTIQKAIESYRILDSVKDYLRTLRRRK